MGILTLPTSQLARMKGSSLIRQRWRQATTSLVTALVMLASLSLPVQAAPVTVSGAAGSTPAMGAAQSEKGDGNVGVRGVTSGVVSPIITAECPPTIRCSVRPAAFQANNGDVTDYGNYDVTDRPRDMKITSIVIHDGEGTCDEIDEVFNNPTRYASTPYIVCADGSVRQKVRTQDLPWHAGNWYYNMHSIGIEHEGHAALGSTEYTPAMYWASAELVKYLTAKFGIPRDRDHIIGHDNVPAPRTALMAGMHTDPGPYWNWGLYMTLITRRPLLPNWSLSSGQITVAPLWPLHKALVTGCSVGDNGCAPEKPQPASFVYLRSEPRLDAPLFTDPVLGQGTTAITNNAARIFWGQTFMVADRRVGDGGVWYKIWVNGATGWFHSPWNAPTTALPESGEYVSSKAGAPVYGRPSPELSEYPADLLASPPASFWIPTLAPTTPLPYKVQPGQKYRLISKKVINDHFYAWAIDSSFPYDHTLFRGKTVFYEIELGGRVGFVRASDVDVAVTR